MKVTPTAHQQDILNNINSFLQCKQYDKDNIAMTGIPKDLSDIKLNTKIKQYNATKQYLFGVLQGKAGTGKTTVAEFIINSALKKFNNICVAYPTHKAGTVIRNKIDSSVEFNTIQSLIGMKPNMQLDHFNPNRPKFGFNKSNDEVPMTEFDFLLIDEASMIPHKVFDYMIKLGIQHDIKILFIGHKAQLPGINDSLSKIFTDVKNIFHLTEVIRQKETNPNIKVLTKLEEDILWQSAIQECIQSSGDIHGYKFDYEKFQEICKNEGISKDRIKPIKSVNEMFINTWKSYLAKHTTDINKETGEGYQCMNGIDYTDTIKNIFNSSKYDDDRNTLQVYNYTNKAVKRNNSLIKDSRNPNNIDIPLFVGETIMAYQNVKAQREVSDSFGVQDKILLANSEDFVIREIQEVETKWKYKKISLGAKGQSNSIFDDVEDMNGEYVDILIPAQSFDSADVSLKAYAVYFDPVTKLNNDKRDFENEFIYIAHPDSYPTLVTEYFKYFKDNGFGFRDRFMKSNYKYYLTLKAFNTLIDNVYYNHKTLQLSTSYIEDGVEVFKKDIDRGYSCTIHKSQGSTKECVGVNLYDIFEMEQRLLNKCPQDNSANSIKKRLDESILIKKLIYVGWSRCSKFAFLQVKA